VEKKMRKKPLYLKKEKFNPRASHFRDRGRSTTHARGIDPYNKLIDRNADDNMIEVTKQ